jgi:Fe-Mn family superoxide dismutase
MFTLIDLPYKSLAPVISDETLSFHHGKHLQTYVDNLNKLIAGTEYEGKSLEEIVAASSWAIFNNAGQILNHNLYFTQFALEPSLSAPTGSLLA